MHDEIKREFPDFWQEHRELTTALSDQFKSLDPIRSELLASDPVEMPKFLDWFDSWFMRRAKPRPWSQPMLDVRAAEQLLDFSARIEGGHVRALEQLEGAVAIHNILEREQRCLSRR